jgi:hypothetical protein
MAEIMLLISAQQPQSYAQGFIEKTEVRFPVGVSAKTGLAETRPLLNVPSCENGSVAR